MATEKKEFDLSNRLFIIVVLLVIGAIACFSYQIFYKAKTLEQQNQNQITVSGEGKVYATPDIATVTLGIETNGKSVKEITQTNVSAMNKIIEEVKNLGIEDKDIQTTQYSVTPQYNYTEKEGRVPNGYTINQNIEVKIRNFDNISGVLDVATQNGANVVSSLAFTIDDPEQFRAEARAKAIEQAKAKAETLAKQAGVKLGEIINVYENNYSYSPVYTNSKTLMGAGVLESTASADIQTGQQEVDLTINLTYKLK